MGGGGSSGPFKSAPSKEIAEKVLESSRENLDASFGAVLGQYFDELLADFNTRNQALVKTRLTEILRELGKDFDGEIAPLFGGSVAKRTDVQGLSDVDTLLRIDETELAGRTPQQVIGEVRKTLVERLSGKAEVNKGAVAVTVTYKDGMEIQLLPVLTTSGGLRIPAWSSDKWSDIKPEAFTGALSKANERLGKRLIPTIKLVKAVNAGLPEGRRLSGYHIESLAIEAFHGYHGEKTLPKLVVHFFDRARELVLRPIIDKTGQSVHVDELLGRANSGARKQAAHLLDRLFRRMQAASASQSIEQWRLLVED